jgi:6-hydroxy-3-succinoylpyridine 3-monooxygenase
LRTIVYVDGYNLYYGLLRRSPHKWLDLFSLFQDHVLDRAADVIELRYYTAPVLARLCDDPASPQRQRTYLQALRKMAPQKVVVIEGRLEAATPYLRLVEAAPGQPMKAKVFQLSEKKTDVSLASDMIAGAFTGAFDQAVLCTNDTDLSPALACIRQHCPHVRLGLVAPIAGSDHRKMAKDLASQVHWSKILSPVHLASAQLPDKIPHTSLLRPENW